VNAKETGIHPGDSSFQPFRHELAEHLRALIVELYPVQLASLPLEFPTLSLRTGRRPFITINTGTVGDVRIDLRDVDLSLRPTPGQIVVFLQSVEKESHTLPQSTKSSLLSPDPRLATATWALLSLYTELDTMHFRHLSDALSSDAGAKVIER
jgi:hypothetical protein